MIRLTTVTFALLLVLLATMTSEAAVIKTMTFTGGSYECEEYPEGPVEFWTCFALSYEESGMLLQGGHFELDVCEAVGDICSEVGTFPPITVWEADLHDPPLSFRLSSGGPFDLLSISIHVNGDDPLLISSGSLERFLEEGSYFPLLFTGWNDIHSFAIDWPLTDLDDPSFQLDSITIRTAPEPGVMLLSLVGLGAATVRSRMRRRSHD